MSYKKGESISLVQNDQLYKSTGKGLQYFYYFKYVKLTQVRCSKCYVVKYFEGSNAVKTTSMHNYTTPLFCCTLEGRNRSTKRSTTSHRGWPTAKKHAKSSKLQDLGSIYSFLLMSNKNLSFLLSNITQEQKIGVVF